MDLRYKFWLLALGTVGTIAAIIGGLCVHFWFNLSLEAQQLIKTLLMDSAGLFFLVCLFLTIGVLFILNEVFQHYVLPLNKLTEETALIASVNPSHRISIHGYKEINLLAQRINEAAARLQDMQETIDREVEEQVRHNPEKLMLNSILEHVPYGLMLCDRQGRILLYNAKAREYISSEETQACGHLGLGKSVFSLIRLFHGDEDAEAFFAIELGGPPQQTRFQLSAAKERLLQIDLRPISALPHQSSGFLLIMQDITPSQPEALRIEGLETPVGEPRSCYDPRLLEQSLDSFTMEEKLLGELACTVFDTETTGLNPKTDEIISLSGVRILNGNLIYEESFNQLIEPRIPVPEAATRVHGLTSENLKGKPPLEEVLPCFFSFAKDTVLVAHCAYFDLLFLQAAEKRTGIRFNNPVLDTLLLSSLVHSSEKDHELECIATRMGTTLYARHTSLGDAMTTAEIFLKLVPLLQQKGIQTLGQALQASERIKNTVSYSPFAGQTSLQTC